MSEGKFSNPRPHRDEERQIEETFRQLTGQQAKPRKTRITDNIADNDPIQNAVYEIPETRELPLVEDIQIEEAFRQVTGQPPVPKQEAPLPRFEDFDPIPGHEDLYVPETDDIVDEPEYDDADFVDRFLHFGKTAAAFIRNHQTAVMLGLCAMSLVIIISFLFSFLGGRGVPSDDGVILQNVYIADIAVGGMSKKEAVSAVKQATSHTYSVEDMVIDLSGTELRLSPKDTKAKLDVEAAVNAAYDYGRTGTQTEQDKAKTQPCIIGLLPYLDLDEEFILNTLTKYAEDTGSTLTQTSYGLEGKEPELSTDKFDENAPCQTLVITMGTPGIGFDVKDVYNKVLDAYSLHTFLVTVENVESTADPDPLDLKAVYEEFYIEPVDAGMDMQTFKEIPGSYGYEFDLAAAQKLVDKAEFGEVLRIPMRYIEPKLVDGDIFFRDTLGEHRTRHTGNENRNTNLRLACKAISGTLLDPGETLSFRSKLGSVSDYRNAPEDTGKDEIPQGGVSQVATTLYNAALMSDLDILSRNNHSYVPSFIDAGLDATADLQIRNSTGYPLRIEAEISGGYVQVRIIGTDERAHYVLLESSISNTYKPGITYEDFEYHNADGWLDGDIIQEGSDGYMAKSYKVKYSKETGQEISRDFIANSQYPAVNYLVARVEPEPTTEPPTEPPTEPATEPTVPVTEPPTEPPAEAPTESVTIPTSAAEPPATSAAEEPVSEIDATAPSAAESTNSTV